MKRALTCTVIGLVVLAICLAVWPDRRVDSWCADVPESLRGPATKWQEVDRYHVYLPSADKTSIAEGMLETAAFLRISEQQFEEFTGNVMPRLGFQLTRDSRPPTLDAYLVRSVYLQKGTGRFSVLVHDGHVHVSHGSLGRSRPAMKRQPLIVLLPQEPSSVSCTCHMAQ